MLNSRNIFTALDKRHDLRPQASSTVHRLALATTAATFPLIFMGGLVTSHHAGLSVPDWPNSYHYNMFLFPPSRWVGGILYEHTHRLMGTVVGMLAIALVVRAWWAQIRRGLSRIVPSMPQSHIPVEPHRYLALSILAAVILQGIIGGLRVVLVKLDLAIVHACFAQAFFCLTAYMALVTSPSWNEARNLPMSTHRSGLVTLGVVTVVAVYLQLMVGATMRHFDAGLAIPDLPLAYGKLLPPTSADGLASINQLRAFQLNLDPVTLPQLWLHFSHRAGAVLVSGLVIVFATKALTSRDSRSLKMPAITLVALLAAQLTLGVLTILLCKPADVATSHVAVGALVLVTSFVLTMRAARLSHNQGGIAEPRMAEFRARAVATM